MSGDSSLFVMSYVILGAKAETAERGSRKGDYSEGIKYVSIYAFYPMLENVYLAWLDE